ncbi:MAG: Mrp/NBP35 family ATP-binding protein [Chitinophagales bacterium]|nr:Mrp/NBP35 family ATP-binding protein [Chitinophagales bacterium]
MEKLPFTAESVLRALSYVDDPDLKKDIVSLNMVQDLHVSGNEVSFRLVLTTPACPLKEVLTRACENAIRQFIGDQVSVQIKVDAEVTGRKPTAVLPQVKNIVAIASGKGGVGKSTVAVNLALALAHEGARVGLLDADIYGPSVPTMLGIKGQRPPVVELEAGLRMKPIPVAGISALSIGLLIEDAQAVVWRGPMVSSALRQLVSDCDWGELDYLIVDLPPGTGDIHLTLVQTVPLSGAVIVTTPQEVALADARKAAAMFRIKPISVPILGVVENMSFFAPPELPGRRYYLFGKGGGKKLADEFQVPLLAEIPMVEQLRELEDEGNLPDGSLPEDLRRAFAELAGEVARQIAMQNASLRQTVESEVS